MVKKTTSLVNIKYIMFLKNTIYKQKNNFNSIKGFTLIELIVVMVILSTLSTIWFISYTSYMISARDSSRFIDMWTLKINLKSSKQQVWSYPKPTKFFTIINSWSSNEEVFQWILDENVSINTISNIPLDPKSNNYYPFSVTKNKQEFQIAITLENDWKNIALLDWDYRTVSNNVFPSIILAISWSGQEIEIHDWINSWSINREKFIVNNWSYNLPYDLTSWNPVSNWNTVWFTWIITEPWVNISINSSYFSCIEINESWKYLWPWEYQILDNSWSIINTTCDESNIY